ncbi:MAG: ABC transporter ATP-binding protein [Rhizobiales bacterium]|nr:ABC transporter ATP-binding protein [Hyphomicrobiales bacterium]OJY46965.1 MAG: branched-chain amino acid ABC transporter ATP-binding protein [Rhizobiales bacterium 64-17]
MTRLLDIQDLTAGYNGVTVLSGVSLHVDEGETVAVVGANGAGKTTLIRAIAGMVHATSGIVTFSGTNITNQPTDRICEAGIAQSPEGRQLFVSLSIEDNLRLGAILKRARARTDDNLARVFDLFPKLKARRHQLAGTLSGGEQQMVAIGRALMAEPKVVMLDEPSLGLAPVMVDLMFDTIADLNKQGMSILLVEQNTGESLALSSRGYVLENGSVVLQGTGEALLQDDRVRKAYLGL